MKTNEERKQEISDLGNMGLEVFEALEDAFTGENKCPVCGCPILQVRETPMTCPECQEEIWFQGSVAYSPRLDELYNAKAEAAYRGKIQVEKIKRIGFPRYEVAGWLRGIASWLVNLAAAVEKGQTDDRIKEEWEQADFEKNMVEVGDRGYWARDEIKRNPARYLKMCPDLINTHPELFEG